MKNKSVKIFLTALVVLTFTLGAAIAGSEKQKDGEKMITDGSKVSMEYTLRLDDGTVADTNVGKEPLRFEQGMGMIIKGLESELKGMKAGDTKKVVVRPEDGYGVTDENAFREVPKSKIPPEAQKPGTVLQAATEDGKAVPVVVREVKEDTVVIDFNHPLAGKTLTFDVKIIDVQ
ncbi:MAG: peptidylprolyl isomerase [Thermodesulfobacteriota bacterium]|nr:MAG: peptidylprolyl isomerase [Thermodesulfobacteriota bacterium]